MWIKYAKIDFLAVRKSETRFITLRFLSILPTFAVHIFENPCGNFWDAWWWSRYLVFIWIDRGKRYPVNISIARDSTPDGKTRILNWFGRDLVTISSTWWHNGIFIATSPVGSKWGMRYICASWRPKFNVVSCRSRLSRSCFVLAFPKGQTSLRIQFFNV